MIQCWNCYEEDWSVLARPEFNDEILCDTCFSEACSDALNSGKGDDIIDTKAFNEIRQTNFKRK